MKQSCNPLHPSGNEKNQLFRYSIIPLFNYRMKRIGFIVLLLLCAGLMIAQERRASVDSAAVHYFRKIESFSPLFYGNEYEGHPSATNHPFLEDDQFTKARLSYQKIIYPEALLRLDLYRNELIVRSPGFRNIVLHPENVDFVELHGKRIIYFQTDSLPGCPSSGYYFLLYSGNYMLLEKRSALLIDKVGRNYINPGQLERYYEFSTRYYLYKDGVYYTIRNKRGLLKALLPYKKELKRFISTRKLNFRNDAEKFLILSIVEYEKLTDS